MKELQEKLLPLLEDLNTMAPVFLWKAAPHSGATYLQRLLRTSDELLVFGETNFPFGRISGGLGKLAQMLRRDDTPSSSDSSSDARSPAEMLEEFASGNYDLYPIYAGPPMVQLKTHFMELFHDLCVSFQAKATDYGFPKWGLKPGIPGAGASARIRGLQAMMPRSKHLFIYRNIQDTLKMLNAQQRRTHIGKWDTTAGDQWAISGDYEWRIHDFCRLWGDSIQTVREKLTDGDDVLMVRFEDLQDIDVRRDTLRDVADFLDLEPLDADLEHDVNSCWEPETGHLTSANFVPPEPLSTRQLETLRQAVRLEFVEELGYAIDEP
ncbi:MAG: hypothetical protein ABEN55_06490 [Bradymonadaceae bacterium]